MSIRVKDGNPVLDVADVVRLEQAIAQRGTSLSELMQRAGHALAQAVEEKADAKNADESANAQVLVLCGSGNNGGDGWVAARELARAGRQVTVVSQRAAADISAEPAHEQALLTHNATLPTLRELIDPAEGELVELFQGAGVIIDAMLGTGFSGAEVREPYATWTRLANAQRARGCRIVAADVPSGLSAQTGKAAEPCVKADDTVTMICLKPGLATPYAFAFCGEVRMAPLADIGDILSTWENEHNATAPCDASQPEGSKREQHATQTAKGRVTTAESAAKGRATTAASATRDAFRRAENEDDDGYDPYSDRPPAPEPLFQENPWD